MRAADPAITTAQRHHMLDVGNKAFPGISYTAKTFPGLTR